MTENGIEEGSLVRAEPLEWAQEICHRMVDVVRLEDGRSCSRARSTHMKDDEERADLKW